MGLTNMVRLGILGSTRGTDMLALIAAIQEKKLAATIDCVISNKTDAMILERARAHGLTTIFIDSKSVGRSEYDAKLSEELHKHNVELIVLIGYMRILSDEFVKTWRHKIINVHPSLLPAVAGGMDGDVHTAVIESGVKETGCTVHYVTEEVDAGPILIQKKCEVLAGDTPESLKKRVQELEGKALVEAINNINHLSPTWERSTPEAAGEGA
jgi:phosphoribosylglycinamide formyltransferase-1